MEYDEFVTENWLRGEVLSAIYFIVIMDNIIIKELKTKLKKLRIDKDNYRENVFGYST